MGFKEWQNHLMKVFRAMQKKNPNSYENVSSIFTVSRIISAKNLSIFLTKKALLIPTVFPPYKVINTV